MRSTHSLAGWLFAAPALTVIVVFFGLPVLAALALSLTDFDIYALADIGNLRFVGLDNYIGLLQNPMFWKSLGNTLYFVVVGVPLSVALSLGAALLLHSKLGRFKGFFRTAFFAPVVTTVVAVAVIWRYLFHTKYGLVNWGLSWVGIDPIDWLGDPAWAMPTIILFAVWKNFGYNMIIFLAGLQSIPEDLYEAARIDGASRWERIRYVIMPHLAPLATFVALVQLMDNFRVFEPIVGFSAEANATSLSWMTRLMRACSSGSPSSEKSTALQSGASIPCCAAVRKRLATRACAYWT